LLARKGSRRIRPNFTLTFGLRYELPGNNFDDLIPVNNRIVAANCGDERFRFTTVPGAAAGRFPLQGVSKKHRRENHQAS
jgi:hypothetical protein